MWINTKSGGGKVRMNSHMQFQMSTVCTIPKWKVSGFKPVSTSH